MIKFESKLAEGEISIFSIVSQMAQKYKAINLGQGYPNYDCHDDLKVLIAKHLNAGKNQYCAMAGLFELRSVIASKANGLYNSSVDPEHEITITAGATQALFTAISAFVHKGDEVIIIEPAYDSYIPSIEMCGGIVKPYTLRSPDYKIDWDEFKNLVSAKTKMVIINTPHNPIGKILSQTDMLTLSSILEGTNIILLSDEVYEHLVYDGEAHQSVLRFPDLYQRSLIVFSFGKTFHATGWKMGYCIGPPKLMAEFRKVHQWNVFSVNSFLQYALAEYLEQPESYNELSSFYQKKRDFFNDKMKGSALKALSCEGTYFQLFDYSAVSSEDDLTFAERLAKDYGVATIPVSAFYNKKHQDKVLRFCFAKTEDMLEEAANKLSKI